MKDKLSSSGISPIPLCIGIAFFICATANFSLWHNLIAAVDIHHFIDVLFLANQFVIALAATTVLLVLFCWPRLVKPVCILFLLIAASTAYFMDNFGVIINRSMIQNIFETDTREAAELLTPKLALYLIGLCIIPAIIVWRIPLRIQPWKKTLTSQLLTILLCLAIIVIAAASMYKQISLVHRQHRILRQQLTPISPIIGFLAYILAEERLSKGVVTPVAEDARQAPSYQQKPHKSLVIFVLGETARADNFQLNGYARQTNPQLSHYPVLNFPNTWSCGTSTAESVPCMFSLLGHAQYSTTKAKAQESLLDVLKRAGISVLWRDNNSDCKGACDRIGMEDMRKQNPSPLCHDGDCFDEILLQGLKEKIASMPGDIFVVLHQKGSHGPKYFLRSPTTVKTFMPECTKENVTDCSQSDIINAYDNTIVYTDQVLAQLIAMQQQLSSSYDTALLYMSDHGESLGENGIYLHGLPYAIAPEQQRHIPFIAWVSPEFAQHTGIQLNCMQSRLAEHYSHDNLFHTIMGMFGVQSQSYAAKLDVFSPCRLAPGT